MSIRFQESILESIILQFALNLIGFISICVENLSFVIGFVIVNTSVVCVKAIFMVMSSQWLIIIEVVTVVESILFAYILAKIPNEVPFDSII